VTLKDAAGHSASAKTASDGSFSVDVTSMTAPFLLSVPSGSMTLYSYAAAGAIANVTPYSSVALQSYYAALGSSVGTVFGGTLSASSFPVSSQLTLLERPIVTLLQPYLTAADVASPATFDLFNTAFTANHVGFDQVLDRTSVDSGLLALTVDNGSGSTAGTLSSSVSIEVTPGNGSTLAQVAVDSTTTNSSLGVSSAAQQDVPVGTNGAQQTDLANAEAGVLTLFNNLLSLATTKGSSVSASDVAPYVDSGYLDEGTNASAFATTVAGFLASVPSGATVTASIYRVNTFSDTSSTDQALDATVELVVTPTSGSPTYNYLDDDDNAGIGNVYRLQTGSWVFYGQQTLVKAHVDLQQSSFYDANNAQSPDAPVIALDVQAQVNVALGTLSGASVSGPADSLPDCTDAPPFGSPLTLSSEILPQDPGTFENGTEDRFDLACAFANAGALAGAPPGAGTLYTFTLTKSTGGSFTQTWPLNSSTTDNGSLDEINGESRSTFAAANSSGAVAGTTLTVNFTPPTTYPLLYSFITVFCQSTSEVASNSGGTDIDGTVGSIPPGTNSGTIAIPTSCDGGPIGSVTVNVDFVGVNGEASQVGEKLPNSTS